MSRPGIEILKNILSITACLPVLQKAARSTGIALTDTVPYSRFLTRTLRAYTGRESFRAHVRFFVARQHQLAYLQMPKVACTSIRTALCLLNRPELAKEMTAGNKIHSHPEWNDMVEENAPELSDYFRFTFVRNPYSRFVSFYWNKLVGKDGRGPVRRFREMGYTPGMTIDDALDMVERTPHRSLDPHLLPQSDFVIRNGRLHVDFIGRLERFAQDAALIEARAGTKLEIGHRNTTNNTRPEEAGRMLTTEQKRRLARLYEKDFELFGYKS